MAEAAGLFAAPGLSARRIQLWQHFEAFVAWVSPWNAFSAIYVDGSYVTSKPEPGDIDAVIELPIAAPATLAVIDPQVFDQDYVYNNFELHLYPWYAGLPFPQNDLRAFFQYVRPEEALLRGLPIGATKGILKLAL